MPALLLAAFLAAATTLQAQSPAIRRINPAGLSTPTGYTHVTVGPDGRTIHVAGQVALDRTGQVVGSGNFRVQAEQVFANLRIALQSVGATFGDVLKITTYVTDVANIAAFRDVRNSVLSADQLPASTFVQVVSLARPEFLLEVEAVAMLRTPLPPS